MAAADIPPADNATIDAVVDETIASIKREWWVSITQDGNSHAIDDLYPHLGWKQCTNDLDFSRSFYLVQKLVTVFQRINNGIYETDPPPRADFESALARVVVSVVDIDASQPIREGTTLGEAIQRVLAESDP
jgi:hypothetical protein